MSRLYLRFRWQRLFPPKSFSASYPVWMNPDLEKRLGLRDRWAALHQEQFLNHSARPEAYELMASPGWPSLFEITDPNVTQIPVEMRNPFFDLRLLHFLLGLPRLPWCCDKEILRGFPRLSSRRGALTPKIANARRSLERAASEARIGVG